MGGLRNQTEGEMANKTHAQGSYLRSSKALGCKVFSSLCGATDDFHAPVVRNIAQVTCQRCIKLASAKAAANA